MLRHAYKVISHLSPTLGQIVEGAYYTFNGWRFDDLKRHVDTSLRQGSGGASFTLAMTFADLMGQQESAMEPKRLAFVTNFPPEDTGIATCSFYSWLGYDGAVDIFCPVADPDSFMTNRMLLRRSGDMRLLDVEAFATACQINRYHHIVIVIGNSDHCAYVQKILKKAVTFGDVEKCTLYVHDACLLNLIQRGGDISSRQMVRALETIYGQPLAHTAPPGARDWEVHGELVARDILGPRWFRSLGFRKFLVNSDAARELLEADLIGTDSVVQTVFHPAFLPMGAETVLEASPPIPQAQDRAALTVGTFGIPSSAKRTEDIAGAVQSLRRGGRDTRLVVAGFGVNDYVERHARLLDGVDLQVFDGPTDVEFVQAMSHVDVAVQLRKENLGESSGVVPQLLQLGKPVVVNAIGSFTEFGEAVTAVSAAATTEEIAHAITRAADDPPREQAIRRYVNDHRPSRFREALFEALESMPAEPR